MKRYTVIANNLQDYYFTIERHCATKLSVKFWTWWYGMKYDVVTIRDHKTNKKIV